ncbi:MAG TPA: cupin domain-containing protein [Solirubrobacterales bacterium]|nr:cupin domain-containing protein [Solirubrobacterales bacterium]
MDPRVIVTGHDAEGRSTAVSEHAARGTRADAFPGLEMFLVWGTRDGIPALGAQARDPVLRPFFPGPGGTRLLLARYAPESSTPETVGSPARLEADAEAKFPGLVATLEPDGTGMHTSDTIDYGVCLEGKLYLELDGGEEVLLAPGTVIVQQGTRHTWHNRGDEPALMCFMAVGAQRR